jgi:hypothetical protein
LRLRLASGEAVAGGGLVEAFDPVQHECRQLAAHGESIIMTVSMYAIAIPAFQKQLASLEAILDKAAEYASEKKIDMSVLLASRLYPDMFDLTRQVQLATDFAKAASARLAGLDVPSFPDTETTLPELKARLARTQALLAAYKPEQFDGSETKQLTLKIRGQDVTLAGQEYLLHVALPNFYFHCATAYGILRHNGLAIGKRDFVGR